MASSNIAVCIPAYLVDENVNDVDMISGDDSASFSSDEEMSNDGSNSPPQETKSNGQLVFIDPAMEDLEKKSKEGLQVLEKLDTILKKYLSVTGANEALRKKVMETMELGKNNPKVVIGVAGATGAGKSSVINALVGEERLVPTSGMRACTAAITEISYKNGPWKYEAEIQFVSRSSWENEMRILFEDMRDGLGETPSIDDSDFGVACAKFKAVYKLPLQSIKTMSIEELMENQNVAGVLGSTIYLSGNDANKFYKEMRRYVDSEESTQASDQDNLETDSISENKPVALWPLVELVRLRVQAPVLSTGVVIVDLPGLLDVNTARGTLAQQYIKDCSGIWVVAPITRAVDDRSARTLLGDGFKHQLRLDGGMGQMAFICTKTDDINLSEAADDPDLKKARDALDTFRKETKQVNQALRTKIKSLKQKGKRLTLKLLALIDDLALPADGPVSASDEQSNDTPSSCKPIIPHTPDGSSENVTPPPSPLKHKNMLSSKKKLQEKQTAVQAQLRSLQKRVRSHDAQVMQKEREFQLQCIEKRNEFSKSRIKEDFVSGLLQPNDANRAEDDTNSMGVSNDIPSIKDNFKIFCVSSKAFQLLEGRFEGDCVTKGFLTTEDTGIPQLQRHCLNLGVAARILSYNNFLNNLGQLVNSLKLQASGQDRVELLQRQDYDRESLYHKLNTLEDELYARLDRASVAGTTAAEGVPVRWNKDRKMGGISYFTYKAICRRSGEFRNGKGKHDWNKELADPMMAIIGPAWERAFINQIPSLLDSASNMLQKTLAEFHGGVMRSVKTLAENDSRSEILKDQLFRYQELTKQTFRFISEKTDSKQKDVNRIFIPTIAQALKPAYNTVYGMKGGGAFQRMKNTITNHVAESKYHMFQQAVEIVKLELEELANVLEDVLRREIEKIFEDMAHDYMTGLKSSNEMEKPLKEEILSFLNSTALFGDYAKVKNKNPKDNSTPGDGMCKLEPIVPSTIGHPEVKLEPGYPDNF